MTVESLEPETVGGAREGSNPDRARRLFRYLAGDEWGEYRAILALFAGTFFVELSPHDVLAQLEAVGRGGTGEDGIAWDLATVEARLSSLEGWGNLTVSSSVGNPQSLEDYYRRRNIYLITREGQEVYDLVEGVLNRIDEVRDMQTGRLRAIHRGLLALDALVAAGIERATPTEVADAVTAVFDAHTSFTEEITQFFASLNQWQSRYDLDEDDLQFFAEILVGYVSEQIADIERLARPVANVLADLEPALDGILARADGGLAGRVDDAGLGGTVSVQATAGRRRRDWEYLMSWYRAVPPGRSRLDELTGQAVQAVRTLTANLTRLSGVGLASASRRNDFVKVARWLDEAAGVDEAHRLMAAAFGLGPSRHVGVLSADVDDPVPTSTSWADAPRAEVPVAIRRRGQAQMRGQPTRIRDRSKEKELLRLRRQREAEAARRTTVELLSCVGADGSVDGADLSRPAFARLQDLIGKSSHHVAATTRTRTVADTEIVCEVERRPGTTTVVSTTDGRLRLIDLDVRLRQRNPDGGAESVGSPGGRDR